MPIPIGNIFAFSDRNDGNGVQVDVYENVLTGDVWFDFGNGIKIKAHDLKMFCPDLNCPHYRRDPDNFDPKQDSCDACQDDEYGENY